MYWGRKHERLFSKQQEEILQEPRLKIPSKPRLLVGLYHRHLGAETEEGVDSCSIIGQ
jgi:hypothetical protein